MKQVLIKNAETQVLSILALCLAITEQGRYHAFFDYSAHTTTISVRIKNADASYEIGCSEPPLADFYTQIGRNDRHAPLEPGQDLSSYQEGVSYLRTSLEAYLAPEVVA